MGPPFSPHSAAHPNLQSLPEGASSHEAAHDNAVISNSNANHNPVTAIITTGPDGAALDDASQQSTISNVSAGKLPFILLLFAVICL